MITSKITIKKPRKVRVTYAEALGWRGGSHLFTRKYDGRFMPEGLPFGNHILIAERMRGAPGVEKMEYRRSKMAKTAENEIHPPSSILDPQFPPRTPPVLKSSKNGDWFAAYSVAVLDGQDVTGEPTSLRWRELCRIAQDFHQPSTINHQRIILADSGHGGEFVQAVVESGGEGVCAHAWDAPWTDDFYAAKRLETFYVVVTDPAGGTQSVECARIEDGGWRMDSAAPFSILYSPSSPRTRVPLLGGKCDRVRVGSILKVEGFGLTAKGCIREPRVCSDAPGSWLVKF